MPPARPVLVALLLVVGLSGGVAAVDTGVLDAAVTEPAAATTAGGSQYVWATEAPALRVHVAAPAFEGRREYRRYEVRVTESRDEDVDPTDEPLATAPLVLEALGDERVTLELDRTDLSERGPQSVFVGLYSGGDLLEGRTLEVVVIHRTGDVDGDGLRNGREVAGGTDFLDPDTDDDDLRDGLEVTEFGTDPLRVDSDGAVTDPIEIRHGTDPWAIDTDGDGLSDRREIEEVPTDPTRADTDGEGLADGRELALGTDPTVTDTDGDGLGDEHELAIGTDPTRADTDGDGVPDNWELARFGTDPTDPASGGVTGTDGRPSDSPSGASAAGESVPASIGGMGGALEGGLLAPVVAIAGGLAARRVLDWATYP
ncbi:MAG: hypothetical protein ABEJ60_08310 [Halodesulfurarchaeum sp.]